MASFDMRQLRTASKSLVLLAVAAPSMCFAQPSLDSSADRQREIIGRVEEEQSRNGPYSEAMIGPLTALALLYQEEGDHLSAIATIERVRGVVRANYGLHSLEQAPLIQQLIDNVEAMGNAEAAWELEQELLALARRNPDDLRTVPIFRKAADSRTAVLRQFLSGEFPPQILLGCYYDFGEKEECNSGTRSAAIGALSTDAQRIYADAIAVMLRNELFSSDELRELEMSIVRNADLLRSYGEGRRGREALSSAALHNFIPYYKKERERLSSLASTVPVGGSSYLTGRMSLERLVSYEYLLAHEHEATADSWANLAAALVRVADWDLLYSVNHSALEEYELTYEMLRAADAPQSSIDELFSPDVPIVLPTFGPSPLSSSQEAERSAGYVDVSFEITQQGRSRRIEVLDTTTNAESAGELVRLIKGSVFRPRVVDGRFDTSRVTVRYYFNQ